MSLLARLERREFAPLQNTGFSNLTNWSGETVNETTALQVSAVMACVGLIADSVASLPIRAVRRIGDRNVPQPTPRLFVAPSTTVTAYELVHQTVSSLALHGNAYVFVDRAANGDPVGLTPIHPNNVEVTSSGSARERTYTVSGTPVPADNILHLRWWTPPQALKGLSPIEEQKTTIGLALAMERHLSQFYADGGTPSSVLETDGDLTANQAKVLQETWFTQHNRRRRPAVLVGGMRWKPVTASAADMELNTSRELQIAQIARIFRVPAYLIGAKGDSQTYSNAEMAGQHFVTYSLLPWLRRIEEAFTTLLAPPEIVRFDVDGFLRADTITRLRAYQIAVSTGIKTPNECRAAEGLEPYAGGDDFVMALPGAPMAGPGTEPAPVGVDEEPPL
jgi:HK97 family phage portal protein